jgi:hypothetical protein
MLAGNTAYAIIPQVSPQPGGTLYTDPSDSGVSGAPHCHPSVGLPTRLTLVLLF